MPTWPNLPTCCFSLFQFISIYFNLFQFISILIYSFIKVEKGFNFNLSRKPEGFNWMSTQFAFAIRYATIFGAGLSSLLAGASTVHYFFAPDLTLPPPPTDLQIRAKNQGIGNNNEISSKSAK
jgi:hypothetical protein